MTERLKLSGPHAMGTAAVGRAQARAPVTLAAGLEVRMACGGDTCPWRQSPQSFCRAEPAPVPKARRGPGEEEEEDEDAIEQPGSAARLQRLPQQLPLSAQATKEGTEVTFSDLAPWLWLDVVPALLSPTAMCRR